MIVVGCEREYVQIHATDAESSDGDEEAMALDAEADEDGIEDTGLPDEGAPDENSVDISVEEVGSEDVNVPDEETDDVSAADLGMADADGVDVEEDDGVRTVIDSYCYRSSGTCTDDWECFPGGCGGELCSSESGGYTTCDCFGARDATCGCVDGRCAWYE